MATPVTKFAYDSNGNVEYLGTAELEDTRAIGKYRIKRIVYDADDNLVNIYGPLLGRWDDRESLAWG